MFPDLFSIGPLTIHTYGVFVALGFTAGLLVTVRLGRTRGIGTEQIMDMGFLIILWAIIGSRALYALLNLPYYLKHPLDILKIWQGGLVFSGGVIAVLLAVAWYLRRHRLPFLTIADLWAPGMALGQSIGRLGCFAAGCCYGRPTDLKWAVEFTHPHSLAPLNVLLHPTQLYHCLAGLIIFLFLLILQGRKKYEGQVFLWLVILHSTARLLIERFRGDERGLILGTEMTLTQLVTLLILGGAVAALLLIKSGTRDKTDRT